MATPLKLKRSAETFKSTIDRTIPISLSTNAHSMTTIAPAFQLLPPPRKKQTINQQPVQITFNSVECENTSEWQRKVGEIIEKDDQMSQRNTYRSYRGHFYTDKHHKGRIGRGGPFQFPARVHQLYQNQSKKVNNPVNFVHGCLSKSGVYYFSIQSHVLFYDIGCAITSQKKLQNCFMKQMEFESTVFELKQIEWRNPIVKELACKNIVAVCQPWKISFMMLEVESFGTKTIKGQRWIRGTMLGFSCDVPSKKVEHLTAFGSNLFFMNEHGGVHHISYEDSGWFDQMISGRRYSLANKVKNAGMTTNHFYANRKMNFSQKLKYFTKILWTEAKDLFKRQSKNYGLVYDDKRQLLFSLVDTNPRTQSFLSYSKILTCWQIKEQKLVQKTKISQIQFYEAEIEPILNGNSINNVSIAKIMQVDAEFYPECCLLIILSNGLRLYTKLTDTFKVISFQFLPNTQTNRRTIKDTQKSKASSLLNCISLGSTAIITLKQGNHNQTLAIWKKNEQNQDEFISSLNWCGSINDAQNGQSPIQNFFFKTTLGRSTSKKWQITNGQSKYNQSGMVLHELLKDQYQQPQIYIHSTDLYIQYFFIMRPIDILLTAITAGITDEGLIRSVLPELNQIQIQMLLIQLLCDTEGIYAKDMSLYQLLCEYAVFAQKDNANKVKFQQFVREQEKKCVDPFLYLPKSKIQRRENATFQGREVINQQLEAAIWVLLYKIKKNEEKINKKYQITYLQEVQEGILNAMLIYLARILRFVWKTQLRHLPKSSIYLIEQIQHLKGLVNKLSDNNAISNLKFPNQQTTNKKSNYSYRKGGYETDSSLDQKQTIPDQQGEKNTINAKIVIRLMVKSQQLILMGCKTDVRISKTFEKALGMQPAYFQQYLFNYLIECYDQPGKNLNSLKLIFPLFVSTNLERAVKIFAQIKNHKNQQIMQILRIHKNVPKYLLDFIRQSRSMRHSQLQQFSSQQFPSKIQYSQHKNPKQMIQLLMKDLKLQLISMAQRNSIICKLHIQLNKYLTDHNSKQTAIYMKWKSELNQIQKIMTVQSLLLQDYKQAQIQIKDITVMEQLERTLLPYDELKEAVNLLNIVRIKILFQLIFMPFDYEVGQSNNQLIFLFSELIKETETVSINKQQNKLYLFWRTFRGNTKQILTYCKLQDSLQFVISHGRSYINMNVFIQSAIGAILQDNNCIYGSIEKAIDWLGEVQLYDREKIQSWRNTLTFPMMHVMLVKNGVQVEQMEKYYAKWLNKVNPNPQIKHRYHILYNWMCFFNLLVEHDRSLSNFANYSYDLLLKIKNLQLMKNDFELIRKILHVYFYQQDDKQRSQMFLKV